MQPAKGLLSTEAQACCEHSIRRRRFEGIIVVSYVHNERLSRCVLGLRSTKAVDPTIAPYGSRRELLNIKFIDRDIVLNVLYLQTYCSAQPTATDPVFQCFKTLLFEMQE